MENVIIECPFCAEEIEKGLEICPQCEEPLGEHAKRTMYTNQGRGKRKESTKAKVWLVIVGIVGIICTVFSDDIIDNLFSDTEETANVSSPKSDDFSSFIQKFTTDEKYQLEHINFPINSIESKDEWEFLGSNAIFNGIKKIEGTEFQGIFFNESDDEYFYQLGYPESETIFVITFTKMKGKWLLTNVNNNLYDDEYDEYE